jgi:hypothetical protein
MVPKNDQKHVAIRMRKAGKTYNEILKQVPVAKSTLSVWLRDVGLANKQLQRITKKRIEAQKLGAIARKTDRIARAHDTIAAAVTDIGTLSRRELLLVGSALYWAEGSKAKPHNISQGLDFGNSDLRMILTYLTWLRLCLGVSDDRISLSIYIHESARSRIEDVKRYWLTATDLPYNQLTYVYYKKHTVRTIRKNIVPSTYYGLLRVRVAKSTALNRVVQGWVLGIVKNYGSLM